MEEKQQNESESTIIVGVRFRSVGKVYHFAAGPYPDLRVDDFVIVETSRGQQLGQVVLVTSSLGKSTPTSLKPVKRRATGRDLAIRAHWEDKASKALEAARAFIHQEKLPIKAIKAEYSFDGKKLAFLYNTEAQADVSALRRYLRKTFRVSVELRQVGPRDAAKTLDGLGACGKVRCCAEFLDNFVPISIRMAKAQGISLSPTEITGMCGRLRCCLGYEHEQYTESLKGLPKKGKLVATPYGQGRIVNLLPLQNSVTINVNNQQVQVHRDEIFTPEEWKELEDRGELPQPKIKIPDTLLIQFPDIKQEPTKVAEKQESAKTSKSSRSRRRRRRKKNPSQHSSKEQSALAPTAEKTQPEEKGEGEKTSRRQRRRRPRKR